MGDFEREGGDIVVNIIRTIHNNHKFFVERMKSEKATNIKKCRGIGKEKKNLSIQSRIAFFFFTARDEIDFRDFHFDLNLN